MLQSDATLLTSENNFNNLSYEVISQNEQLSKMLQADHFVQTVTNKNYPLVLFCSSSLQLNYKCKEPVTISFTDKLFYTPYNLDSFKGGIPFYLNLTQLHKTTTSSIPINCSNSSLNSYSSKYSYIEIYLGMYNSLDEKLCQALITPNTNILLDTEFFSQKGLKVLDISYFNLSMVIKDPCKINLNYFMFGFSDFMSTDTFYSKNFDVTVRLQVNNLKKKKNGVVIFFPSFYIKERDTDSINNNDNSVKWPNFTRYTWSRDLENYCTIFVADPFQFANGNDKSSWFIAPNGESVIPEIAAFIKSLLNIQNRPTIAKTNDTDNTTDITDLTTSTKNNATTTTSLTENNSSISVDSHNAGNLTERNTKHNAETSNISGLLSSLRILGKSSNKETCGPIINYGSSMGGYAAFLFSCYLEPDLCFCECPQANLMKYKYSKEYLETCDGLGLKDIPSLISSLLSNERAKQKALLESNIVQKFDLSFSAILRNHHPKFRSLIHFYSLDKLHLTSFENEIHSLTDEELKTFNYQLVIENDIENQLFTHQAMPKEKVLDIFNTYLSKKRK